MHDLAVAHMLLLLLLLLIMICLFVGSMLFELIWCGWLVGVVY